MEIQTNSARETKKLARNLAKKLKGGEIIALFGDLGSGKTTFVQGLVEGLGIKARVQSPTFVLIRLYKGERLSVAHIDLYRLSSESEVEDLGLEDFFCDRNIISVVEWADKMDGFLPKGAIKIKFEYVSENVRKINFKDKYV